MAEARPQDFITSLQNLLGNNLDDPNKDRDNLSSAPFGWIYNTPVKFGPAQYPRIHITKTNQQYDTFEIGTDQNGGVRLQNNGLIDIIIVNHVNGEFDIDGDGEVERPNDVSDDLATKVADQIKDNQSRWRDLGDNSLNMIPLNQQEVELSKDSAFGVLVEAQLKNIR